MNEKYQYQMLTIHKESNKKKYRNYRVISYPTNDNNLQQNIKQYIIIL